MDISMRFYLVFNIPGYPIEPHHLQEAINSVMRDHIQGEGNAIVRGNVSLLKIHQKGEEPLLLLSLLIVSQILHHQNATKTCQTRARPHRPYG